MIFYTILMLVNLALRKIGEVNFAFSEANQAVFTRQISAAVLTIYSDICSEATSLVDIC
jgi:hypothetical protein